MSKFDILVSEVGPRDGLQSIKAMITAAIQDKTPLNPTDTLGLEFSNDELQILDDELGIAAAQYAQACLEDPLLDWAQGIETGHRSII
mgnify:CR=1 FL=1